MGYIFGGILHGEKSASVFRQEGEQEEEKGMVESLFDETGEGQQGVRRDLQTLKDLD